MKIRQLLAVLLLLSVWLFRPGLSEAELLVGAGYAVGVSPYRNHRRLKTVIPLTDFENNRFYLRDLSAGFKFYNSENLKLALFLGYDSTNFDRDESSDWCMKQLNNSHESVLMGGEARWNGPIGHFGLSLGGDLSGHSRGFAGRLACSHPLGLGPVELAPQVGAYWASGSYNNNYYGAFSKEALRSGLAAYEAGAALSLFAGLAVGAALDRDEHWGIFCHGEVLFLPSTIKNSPMVGRSATRRLTAGLTYTFWRC